MFQQDSATAIIKKSMKQTVSVAENQTWSKGFSPNQTHRKSVPISSNHFCPDHQMSGGLVQIIWQPIKLD